MGIRNGSKVVKEEGADLVPCRCEIPLPWMDIVYSIHQVIACNLHILPRNRIYTAPCRGRCLHRDHQGGGR